MENEEMTLTEKMFWIFMLIFMLPYVMGIFMISLSRFLVPIP